MLLVACNSPSPIQISQSGTGAFEASLATGDSGFAVAWHDTRDGNAEIYLRSLDVEGRPSGPERRLTDSPDASYEASLERLGDMLVVAWYEHVAGQGRTAMLGAWDRDGARKWVHSLAPSTRNPVVRADGQSIFCTWIQGAADGGEAVWAGWWSGDGRPQRDPVRIGPASRDTWNLNAAVERSGTAWVVFDAVASTQSSELFLALVDSAGARLERITRDDGSASKYPDLAIDEQGRVALTWYDERDGNEEVYLLVAPGSGLTGEIDARARRVTTTPGQSIGAYVAWNAGRVGLAWSDEDSGGQHEVYFQSFDASGAATGAMRRLTRNETWSLVPAIQSWGDGFALAWNEYAPAAAGIHEGTSEIGFALVR